MVGLGEKWKLTAVGYNKLTSGWAMNSPGKNQTLARLDAAIPNQPPFMYISANKYLTHTSTPCSFSSSHCLICTGWGRRGWGGKGGNLLAF